MSLTKEEKAALELEITQSKSRMKKTWAILQQLDKFTKSYLHEHATWRKRFEVADRRLAVEERLIKCPSPGRHQPTFSISGLSKAQIIAIAQELNEEEDN